MVPDIDILRSANILLRQHGAEAAATRADELLDLGDVEGAAVWRRILAALRDPGYAETAAGLSRG